MIDRTNQLKTSAYERQQINDRTRAQASRRKRIPASRARSPHDRRGELQPTSGIRSQPHRGTHRGARPHLHLQGGLDGRQGRSAGQHRLPGTVQQRHRSLQGRSAVPPLGEPLDPEVPRLRADFQKCTHDTADGRRKGRVGFQPQRQVGPRGDALLPGFHDRTVASHRSPDGRSGRRHRCRRP